jgi:Integrase core domain/GAG-pre-integrase domain
MMSLSIWHKRLGHPSCKILNRLFGVSFEKYMECDIYKLAKLTKPPFQLPLSKSSAPFELVHSDVWGPAPIASYNEFKYFVTFIDDFSRATWLFLLKIKDEVFDYFQEFLNRIENQFNTTIKIFRSDNRTEFKNNKFNELVKLKGIIHQTTCVNTPEKNGVSKRKNRHLLEVTRALLFQNNIPKVFWSDAILSATYLINRLPSIKLKNKSPLEILYQRTINIEHLRIFDCVAFVKIKRKSKLDFISTKTIFLEYSSVSKGYKYFDPINNFFSSLEMLVSLKMSPILKNKK